MGREKEKTRKDAIICQPSQGDQYKQGPKQYINRTRASGVSYKTYLACAHRLI
jgi:hypothetical protein